MAQTSATGDLLVDEHTLTLHLEHYMGISIVVPDSADDTVLSPEQD